MEAERDPLELAVEAAYRLIVAYCALFGETGANLHTVVDDFGIAEANVRAEVEHARREGDDAAEAIAELLLSLPLEHRARAVNPWLCAKCGHSVILHDALVTLDEPPSTVSTTAAYRGPCELDGCECQRGDPELD